MWTGLRTNSSQVFATVFPFRVAVFPSLRSMATTDILDIDTPIIPIKEARRFIVDCLVAAETPQNYAEEMADVLVEADYRGHYSHGMNRLDMYVKEISLKVCDASAAPKIVKDSPATALVDGQNGLGVVVGNFCTNLAIKKAKEVGIGWVCATGSNHYGIAGWYTLKTIKEGLLGMSFTNTSPWMSPTRSKEAALGTNPLSLAAPAEDGDHFCLDMATTTAAVGKIEMQKRKKQPLPLGWAQDEDGKPTTDADLGFKVGCLMPLGGSEITSGYKGFGLGMLVEIFCGILSGSDFGPNIRRWGNSDRNANLGQCFVAIDPKCFAPGFEGRMSDLMNHIRSMEPSDPELKVLVAGDAEKLHMQSVDKNGGVRYVQDQMNTCSSLAEEYKVAPLKPLY